MTEGAWHPVHMSKCLLTRECGIVLEQYCNLMRVFGPHDLGAKLVSLMVYLPSSTLTEVCTVIKECFSRVRCSDFRGLTSPMCTNTNGTMDKCPD